MILYYLLVHTCIRIKSHHRRSIPVQSAPTSCKPNFRGEDEYASSGDGEQRQQCGSCGLSSDRRAYIRHIYIVTATQAVAHGTRTAQTEPPRILYSAVCLVACKKHVASFTGVSRAVLRSLSVRIWPRITLARWPTRKSRGYMRQRVAETIIQWHAVQCERNTHRCVHAVTLCGIQTGSGGAESVTGASFTNYFHWLVHPIHDTTLRM